MPTASAPPTGSEPDLDAGQALAPEPAQLLGTGRLSVSDGHEIAFEVSGGAADGIPALYLHGGDPAGGSVPGYRRNAPSARTRLVGIHQRGAGDSTPPSAGVPGPVDLSSITTARLVADIEALRQHLDIEDWIVQGVSWGLDARDRLCAGAPPREVRAMMLMAVTTTSRREVDWITEGDRRSLP